MPLHPKLLEILVCPEDKTPVRLAEAALIQKINVAIQNGQIRNRVGEIVQETLQSGLIRSDGKYLYPVRDDIPVMLIDQAIPL